MHHATYHTMVYWLPASPLGLVGNRWAIDHHCNLCRQLVPTDQLIDHSQHHARHEERS